MQTPRRADPEAVVMLFLQPAIAVLMAFVSYACITVILPGFLSLSFSAPPGDPSAVSAEQIRERLTWVGVIAAVAFLGQAWYLARKAWAEYTAWRYGRTPACPRCGGIMKRRRRSWRCYRAPTCPGQADI